MWQNCKRLKYGFKPTMPDKRKYDTGSIKIKIVPVIDWDFLSHKKKNPKNRIIQNDQQIFL